MQKKVTFRHQFRSPSLSGEFALRRVLEPTSGEVRLVMSADAGVVTHRISGKPTMTENRLTTIAMIGHQSNMRKYSEASNGRSHG
jgi:hypothetical protein